MEIILFKFAKPENSTKIPTDSTPHATYNCTLKENVSVMAPAVEFAFTPATANPTEYNYMWIPEFNRFYFIDAWGYNRRVWVCTSHVDVLGSFRDDIFNMNAYILRSVYKRGSTGYYFNPDIKDSTYPVTDAAPVYTANSMINILNAYQNNAGEWFRDLGVYIVGIVSDQSTSGATTYYAFPPVEFASFMSNLFGSVNWADIPTSEISQGLQKALINPFQYIVSCTWCPFAVDPNYGIEVDRVRVGWTTFQNVHVLMMNYGAHETRNVSLTIPRHPQSARGNYLNTAPYTFYTLKYYPFGCIDINANDLVNYNTLDIYTDIDLCSGEGILTLAVNNRENPIRQMKAQVCVPIPVAQIAIDIAKIGQSTAIAGATGLVQSVAQGGKSYFNNVVNDAKSTILGFGDRVYSFITGNDISSETGHAPATERTQTGALSSTISSIVDSAAASSATVEMHGGVGSRSGYYSQNLSLSGKFFTIADENIWHYGRPLCKSEKIGDMQYFIQTDRVYVDIAAACVAEQTAIKSYLMGGCYIE